MLLHFHHYKPAAALDAWQHGPLVALQAAGVPESLYAGTLPRVGAIHKRRESNSVKELDFVPRGVGRLKRSNAAAFDGMCDLDPGEYVMRISGHGTWRPLSLCGDVKFYTSKGRCISDEHVEDALSSTFFDFSAPEGHEIVSAVFRFGTCWSVATRELQVLKRRAQTPSMERGNCCCICFEALTHPEVNFDSCVPEAQAVSDPSFSLCRRLQCGHLTCNDCLRTYVQTQMESWNARRIGCPAIDCQTDITLDHLREFFPEDREVINRVADVRAATAAQAHPRAAKCPAPDCRETVYFSAGMATSLDKASRDVTCSAGHCFCFHCGHFGGHSPLSCSYHKKWRELVGVTETDIRRQEEASSAYLQTRTKPCPRCGTVIQRTEGCNHMVCTICGDHFCYECGQAWSRHRDFYNCPFVEQRSDAENRHGHGGREEDQWQSRCIEHYWQAQQEMTRSEEVGKCVDALSVHLGLELEPGFAAECGRAIAEARCVLGHCYAAKFYLRGRWPSSLESPTGLLESLTQTLEACVLRSALQALPRSLQRKHTVEQVWRGHNAAAVAGNAEALASGDRLALVRELRYTVQTHVAKMKSHGTATFQQQAALEERERTALPQQNRDNRAANLLCTLL